MGEKKKITVDYTFKPPVLMNFQVASDILQQEQAFSWF
jgi:hypothetical protein